MHIVVSWNYTVTKKDYVRDPLSWSGGYSNIIVSDDSMTPMVANDMEILKNLKDTIVRDTKHKIYT